MRLVIQAYGEQALSRKLERFSERALDASPAFARIAILFWQSERVQFDTGGAFSGGWAPLADSTVAGKARRFEDPRVLIATYSLAASLTSAVAPGSVYSVTPYELFVGSDIFYGAFHQRGTVKMPMRKPVELPEVEKRDMVKVLQAWIVRGELI